MQMTTCTMGIEWVRIENYLATTSARAGLLYGAHD